MVTVGSRQSGEREIYPNAPLRLVAAEVRYPLSPRLASLEPASALERLGNLLPLVEEEQQMLQMMVGPPGVQLPELPKPPRRVRLLSKGRDLAATISGMNTILESTAYKRFEVFLDVLTQVLNAIEKLGPPVGVARLGLRYIDEIRVPDITEPPGDWHGYVDGALVSAIDLVGGALGGAKLQPRLWQNLIQFSGGDGRGLQVSIGAGLGTVVNVNGPLRFPGPIDTGPSFIVDMDSYWEPAELADFSPSSLAKISQELHEPLHDVFERTITDRLRDEVLRARKEG